MLAALVIFIGIQTGWAQQPSPAPIPQPPPPAMPQPPPAATTTENPNLPQPNPAPVAPIPLPPPPTSPATAENPNLLQPNPSQQPLLAPLPPSLSVPANFKKLQQAANSRVKSPFMIPNELYLKLLKKKGENQVEVVDLSIEPKRRFSLKFYRVVAVIWNVKNPKAMILDKDGGLHLFREKDYIANQEGFVTEINNGEVVVLERGIEHRLKLTK